MLRRIAPAAVLILLLAQACGAPHLPVHRRFVYNTAVTVRTPRLTRIAPLNVSDPASLLFDELAFETLLKLNPQGRIVPGLARHVSRSADGSQWTLTLDPRAKWWTGRPVTGSDVVWSVEFYRHLKRGPRSVELRQIVSVTAPRPTEVIIRLKRPDPGFAKNVLTGRGALWILPSFLLRRLDPSRVAESQYLTDIHDLVGDGPFRPVRMPHGGISWTANPHFFEGAPKVKHLRWTWNAPIPAGSPSVAWPDEPGAPGPGYVHGKMAGTRLWYLHAGSTQSLGLRAAQAALAGSALPGYAPSIRPWALGKARGFARSQTLTAVLTARGYRKVHGRWLSPTGAALAIRMRRPAGRWASVLFDRLKQRLQHQGIQVRSAGPGGLTLLAMNLSVPQKPLTRNDLALAWQPA